MITIFDWQHQGKPGRNDRGAISGDLVEVELTRAYGLAAQNALEAAGHEVHWLTEGWYSDRHKQANIIARDNPDVPVAYVALHVNAGGGTYSLNLHDSRSSGGRALAESIAAEMDSEELSGVTRTLVQAADASWVRARPTIDGILSGPRNICGTCHEPVFIDNPKHQAHLTAEGLLLLGLILARGIMQWGASRG